MLQIPEFLLQTAQSMLQIKRGMLQIIGGESFPSTNMQHFADRMLQIVR